MKTLSEMGLEVLRYRRHLFESCNTIDEGIGDENLQGIEAGLDRIGNIQRLSTHPAYANALPVQFDLSDVADVAYGEHELKVVGYVGRG